MNTRTTHPRGDRYLTPLWCVDRLCESDTWRDLADRHHTVYDPCAAGGDMIRHYAGRVDRCYEAADRWPAEPSDVVARDVVRDPWPVGLCCVVTNPPYSRLDEVLRAILTGIGTYGAAAMLLPLPWLQQGQRQGWLRKRPPARVLVLPERPSFSGGTGTAGAGYAWFVWGPLDGTVEILPSTPVDVRRESERIAGQIAVEADR